MACWRSAVTTPLRLRALIGTVDPLGRGVRQARGKDERLGFGADALQRQAGPVAPQRRVDQEMAELQVVPQHGVDAAGVEQING